MLVAFGFVFQTGLADGTVVDHEEAHRSTKESEIAGLDNTKCRYSSIRFHVNMYKNGAINITRKSQYPQQVAQHAQCLQ